MLFNSITFFVFLLIVYALYRILPHKGQNFLLLIASYVFYGWWDIRFLFLIILSTTIDYSSGLMIHFGRMSRRERLTASLWLVVSSFVFVVVRWSNVSLVHDPAFLVGQFFQSRSGWLIFSSVSLFVLAANLIYAKIELLNAERKRLVFLMFSVVANLGFLGFFKYYNFFIENVEVLFQSLNLDSASLRLDIVLPVGISFFIFQTLSYTIDVYRRKMIPTSNFTEYALCVAFFPKLLAGPIERAVNLLPQLTGKRQIGVHYTIRGLNLIFYGLFKKVVIADGVAKTVSGVFAATNPISWIDAVVGTILFAIEIYCDFSGYSDIAIGTSSLFGIDLMRNFHFPYFSRNPSEFWSRWHISLSSWFRDYVFFPLGGPYGKTLHWMRNVMITFFLTGLWHGAAWNYILWGVYHGALLCLHRIKETFRPRRKRRRNAVMRFASIAGFFGLTCYGWILFHARSMEQIKSITSLLVTEIGDLHLSVPMPTPAAIVGLPLFFLSESIGYASDGKRLDEVLPVPLWTATYAVMIFAIILGAAYVPSKFIYFVF